MISGMGWKTNTLHHYQEIGPGFSAFYHQPVPHSITKKPPIDTDNTSERDVRFPSAKDIPSTQVLSKVFHWHLYPLTVRAKGNPLPKEMVPFFFWGGGGWGVGTSFIQYRYYRSELMIEILSWGKCLKPPRSNGNLKYNVITSLGHCFLAVILVLIQWQT